MSLSDSKTSDASSKDYHEYVIKNGVFIGRFEEMYRNIEDPWHHDDAHHLQYDILLTLLKHTVPPEKIGAVLDIGCGKGAFTARLREMYPHAYFKAVDISQTAIRKAENKFGSRGIDFQVMDINKEYTRIREKFDLILLSQVMWYILPSLKAIISRLYGVCLSKTGALVFNQCFYPFGVQEYGADLMRTPEDMFDLLRLKPKWSTTTSVDDGNNIAAVILKAD